MPKQIALVMRQRFVGEALAALVEPRGAYALHILSDFGRALWYCRDFTPDLVLVEISDATDSTAEAALRLTDAFSSRFPLCKRMLFISKSDQKSVLPAAIRARQEHRIEGFVTADAGNEYVIASIQALI